jgi:hypothetical protein
VRKSALSRLLAPPNQQKKLEPERKKKKAKETYMQKGWSFSKDRKKKKEGIETGGVQ